MRRLTSSWCSAGSERPTWGRLSSCRSRESRRTWRPSSSCTTREPKHQQQQRKMFAFGSKIKIFLNTDCNFIRSKKRTIFNASVWQKIMPYFITENISPWRLCYVIRTIKFTWKTQVCGSFSLRNWRVRASRNLGWNLESASQVVIIKLSKSKFCSPSFRRMCPTAVRIPQLQFEHFPGISLGIPKGWTVKKRSWKLVP